MSAPGPCRWCSSHEGEVVLDLGCQPASDHFPRPDDPGSAVYPLRLWRCCHCALVQLPDRSPIPEEPRGVEPEALRAHAGDSVTWALLHGLLAPGRTVVEFGSPHGGSWTEPLSAAGLRVRTDTSVPAHVVVDVFGLMHEEDQRAGLQRRLDALDRSGILLLVFPPLETIVKHGQWNAARHGHHAYPSTAVLGRQLAECGLAPVATALHPLYGGTRLLAARERDVRTPLGLPPDVPPAGLRSLTDRVSSDVRALRDHLERAAADGRRVFGYSAASRAVPLLAAAAVSPDLLPAVADTSPAKQGRLVPGVGIPVISPVDLVAARPDEVLLLLPDLLGEVRAALPEIEKSGGRWSSVDGLMRKEGAR
jgi:hypothetical protein